MGSEWILGRLAGGVWIGSSWLRIGDGGGLCEHGDEPSGSGATELAVSTEMLVLSSRKFNLLNFFCRQKLGFILHLEPDFVGGNPPIRTSKYGRALR
jgi:hypothetical protein